MDTRGHGECGKVSRDVLQKAFEKVEKHEELKKLMGVHYLAAYCLGNWLTDVSQVIDPVAFSKAINTLPRVFDALLKKLNDDMADAIKKMDSTFLRDQATQLQQKIVSALETWRDYIEHDVVSVLNMKLIHGGKESEFGKVATKATKVKGYLEFVHPKPRGGPVRLNYCLYEHIFNQRFTQYFPHEHLDRWPDELDLARDYIDKTLKHTLTPSGWGSGSAQDPDVGFYLRHGIYMAAGLLAEVDLWARAALAPNGILPDDEARQKEWAISLAKLGHAIHVCEDYFTHSNYVEQALRVASNRDKLLNDRGFRENEKGMDTPWIIFCKRITILRGRRDPPPLETWQTEQEKWATLKENDPYLCPDVYTGTFDFADTLHSLHHIVKQFLNNDADKGIIPASSSKDLLDNYQRRQVNQMGILDRKMEKVDKGEAYGSFMAELCRAVQEEATRNGQSALTMEAAKRHAEKIVPQMASGNPNSAARGVAQDIQDIPPEAKDIRQNLFDAIGMLTQHPVGEPSLFDLITVFFNVMSWVLGLDKALETLINEFLPPQWQIMRQAIKEGVDEKIHGPLKIWIEDTLGKHRVGSHSLFAKDYLVGQPQVDDLYSRARNCAMAVDWYVVRTLVRWSEPQDVAASRDVHKSKRQACATVNTREYIDWLELLEFFLRHPHGKPDAYGKSKEEDRWWWTVVRDNDWKKLPGYEDDPKQRSSDLPHRLRYYDKGSEAANRKEVTSLINRARDLRQQAEAFYNMSIDGKPLKIPSLG